MRAVSFDYSGTYLGIGGGGAHGQAIHVKVVKDWSNSVVSGERLIVVLRGCLLIYTCCCCFVDDIGQPQQGDLRRGMDGACQIAGVGVCGQDIEGVREKSVEQPFV